MFRYLLYHVARRGAVVYATLPVQRFPLLSVRISAKRPVRDALIGETNRSDRISQRSVNSYV